MLVRNDNDSLATEKTFPIIPNQVLLKTKPNALSSSPTLNPFLPQTPLFAPTTNPPTLPQKPSRLLIPAHRLPKQPLRLSTIPHLARSPSNLAPPTHHRRIHDTRQHAIHSAQNTPADSRGDEADDVGVEGTLRGGCVDEGGRECQLAGGADPGAKAEGEGCDEAGCAQEEEGEVVREEVR